MSPRSLLDSLLSRCLAGDCDNATAAKQLGIRRASIAELIRQYGMQRSAHLALVGAFNDCFPECNPKLRRPQMPPELTTDNLLRAYPIAPCRTYTAEEAAHLAPSESKLLMPDAKMAFISYNTNWKVENIIGSASCLGMDPDDDEPMPEMSGPEFDFAA